MNRPRHALALALARVAVSSLLVGAVLAGCSSSEEAAPATSALPADDVVADDTTPTTEADPTGASAGIDGLRGVRYCEVLLLTDDEEGFSAAVWNTMGMSECPADQWEALDAAAIAQERGAVAALLNGPRYWTLDSITTDLRAGAPETTFGEIGMFQAATVALGDELPSQTPYTERSIQRDTVFGFAAGSEVYELVAPDGTTYVMQSWSQSVDPALEEADLAGLGGRLEMPTGWGFQTRALEEPLDVLSDDDGVAVVVQDELQNTYQRIDRAS